MWFIWFIIGVLVGHYLIPDISRLILLRRANKIVDKIEHDNYRVGI